MKQVAVRSLQFVVLCCLVATQGCKVYSFSGANIPADIHSFSTELIQNRSGNGPASLPQIFTDKLKYKFQTEANLRQASNDGDLQFTGSVTGYTFTSDAPIAGATSALNKLTITVQITFVNTKNEKDKWVYYMELFGGKKGDLITEQGWKAKYENLIKKHDGDSSLKEQTTWCTKGDADDKDSNKNEYRTNLSDAFILNPMETDQIQSSDFFKTAKFNDRTTD